jgi:hypothetical protein
VHLVDPERGHGEQDGGAAGRGAGVRLDGHEEQRGVRPERDVARARPAARRRDAGRDGDERHSGGDGPGAAGDGAVRPEDEQRGDERREPDDERAGVAAPAADGDGDEAEPGERERGSRDDFRTEAARRRGRGGGGRVRLGSHVEGHPGCIGRMG